MRILTVSALMTGAFFVFVAFSPIIIRVRISIRGLSARVAIQVRCLYGLVRYSVESGLDGRDRPGKGGGKGFASAGTRAGRGRGPAHGDYLTALRYLATRATLMEFDIRASLGLGDAAATGIATGLAWGAVGALVAAFRNIVPRWSCEPYVSIEPVFHARRLEVDSTCIVGFRAGDAIVAAGLLAVRYLRGAVDRG